MRVPPIAIALSKNLGSSDSVRKPCAIGPPNGPALAFSTSTWIHWWSPVAWANRLTCSWVTVIQSLVATSWPTSAGRSASEAMVLMPALYGRPERSVVQPATEPAPLLQVAFDAARRDVEQREAARRQVHIFLGRPQFAQHRQAQSLDEGLQLVGRDGAAIHPRADDAHLQAG